MANVAAVAFGAETAAAAAVADNGLSGLGYHIIYYIKLCASITKMLSSAEQQLSNRCGTWCCGRWYNIIALPPLQPSETRVHGRRPWCLQASAAVHVSRVPAIYYCAPRRRRPSGAGIGTLNDKWVCVCVCAVCKERISRFTSIIYMIYTGRFSTQAHPIFSI